jgi:hypothetical protein
MFEILGKTFLTASEVEHTLAPESSDGFASVGAASHRKRVALLPGGPFCLWKRWGETAKSLTQSTRRKQSFAKETTAIMSVKVTTQVCETG